MGKRNGLGGREPGWWIPGFDQAARDGSVERITEGSTPGLSYYILIVLSALIASYGLLANSTATVIGAMIVAPLMGPILGLALGIVVGDTKTFRRSLVAEVSGVLLVVAVGFLVAHMVGVEQIDFGASEIANRTRPTLYDLAIGLAAGLAGAFCMVHPGLQAGIAGVAIAVALVPPLTVTGITIAGWLAGSIAWRPAFGSFVLFLANFLTIELAACLLFYACGFHFEREGREGRPIRRAIAVNLILLSLTGVFLAQQLKTLVNERIGQVTARRVLTQGLASIPGADLDSVDVTLNASQLAVTAVIGTRREITPEDVSSLQTQLGKALSQRLPGVTPNLVVRTVGSVYVSSTGYLFEPKGEKISPEQMRLHRLEIALREELGTYPEVELDTFRPIVEQGSDQETEASPPWDLEVTLRSPYDFTPPMVEQLEQKLSSDLQSGDDGEKEKLRLLVRTIIVRAATMEGRVDFAKPGSVDERDNSALRQLVLTEIEKKGGYEVDQIVLRRRPAIADGSSSPLQSLTAEAYEVTLRLRGRAFLTKTEVDKIRADVTFDYRRTQGRPIDLKLSIEVVLAQTLTDG